MPFCFSLAVKTGKKNEKIAILEQSPLCAVLRVKFSPWLPREAGSWEVHFTSPF
jgi:hypothetical protein